MWPFDFDTRVVFRSADLVKYFVIYYGRVLSSSVCWDGVADRGSWGVLGGLVRWNERGTVSCCCFFLALVQPRPPGGGAWFRFWGQWRRLVSSPSLLVRRWLGCGAGVSGGVSTLFGGRGILSAPCRGGGRLLRLRGAAAAAFSSAQREGLGGRDRGDAGCPEEDGGGRDMDAC